MTRISRIPIEKDIWERVWNIFLDSLSSLKKESTADFVNDLFSDAEKIMLAKRLSVALMVIKDYSPAEISDTLKVSPSTVNSVKKWLNIKGEGYRMILSKIVRSEEMEHFFQNIDEILYKMGHPKRIGLKLPAREQRKRAVKRLL